MMNLTLLMAALILSVKSRLFDLGQSIMVCNHFRILQKLGSSLLLVYCLVVQCNCVYLKDSLLHLKVCLQ